MDDESRLHDRSKHAAITGLALVALFAVYILVYLTIHVWVSAHALESSGQLASLLTFCLPVLGDAYWGIRQWLAAGPTPFALTAIVGAVLGLLSYPLQSFGSRWVQRKRSEMLRSVEAFDSDSPESL